MNAQAGQTWEWHGFEDEESIRVTLLIVERIGYAARCMTLCSSREDVWPLGEIASWNMVDHARRWKRIA